MKLPVSSYEKVYNTSNNSTVTSTWNSKPALALKRAKPFNDERLRKQQQNLINRVLRKSPETQDLLWPAALPSMLMLPLPPFFLISLRKALTTGIEMSLVQWSAATEEPQMLARDVPCLQTLHRCEGPQQAGCWAKVLFELGSCGMQCLLLREPRKVMQRFSTTNPVS